MDMRINSFDNMPKLTMANATAKPVKTEDFISGVSDDIHSVIISGSKADLALQMTLQVRNKVMDAYKEIMNMQI